MLFPNPVQLIPSGEYARVFVAPRPLAINRIPVQNKEKQVVNIIFPNPVQLIPSVEYAKVFVPSPPATHRVPFHAIL